MSIPEKDSSQVQTGASRTLEYLGKLEGKKIGLVVNHTALIGSTHLADTMLSLGLKVQKVFVPEHGFRGDADAGENVQNSKDSKTGIPLISLYGNQKKPGAEHLKDLDILIFDIQDVGARFYTYISTMHYVMEACAENNKKLMILDRPNPNGAYIDGPILENALKSFVGIHPIPILHGLTIAELAQMINGEKWLSGGLKCDLEIIPMLNYTHHSSYSLPVKPSPNLPNDLAIRLYPSLCLFEGTAISVGRGTQYPFQVLGYPNESMGSFQFVPESIPGMSKNPKYQGQKCFGIDLRSDLDTKGLNLKFLLEMYAKFPDKGSFFNTYFDTLVGTYTLQQQIRNGISETEIRQSWENGLSSYKSTRAKYLIYPE